MQAIFPVEKKVRDTFCKSGVKETCIKGLIKSLYAVVDKSELYHGDFRELHRWWRQGRRTAIPSPLSSSGASSACDRSIGPNEPLAKLVRLVTSRLSVVRLLWWFELSAM